MYICNDLSFDVANKYFFLQGDDLLWKLSPAKNVLKGDSAGGLSNGYRRLQLHGIAYSVHRTIWLLHYGSPPSGQIDHINHDRLDNRIENMRDVTNQENQRNRKVGIANKSGVIGVSWHSRDMTWGARITVDGVVRRLGSFGGFFDAVCARKSAELRAGFHENHGR